MSDRKLLLVLDNCEHLLARLRRTGERMLQAGPRLKVLATSREPLRVAGEASYQVPAACRPGRRDVAARGADQCDSVRLFSDRAAAAQPAFQLTAGNATAVAAICHRLDGIPLALELAAARVRSLPVETIAERLSDRFRVLTGGSRTALPRQQTLRACIDWSYDLLDRCRAALLRRLAVFAGGWTLEAAEAVGAGGEIDRGGCPRAVDPAGRQIPRGVRPQTASLPAAGDGAAVCARTAAWRRRSREEGARTRHLDFYLALVGPGGREIVGSRPGILARAPGRGAREPARGARMVRVADARAELGAAPPPRQCSSTGCAAACCAWATR